MSAERPNEVLKILGQEVEYESPCGKFKILKVYVKGHHPGLGVITTKGFTGDETIIMKTVVVPFITWWTDPDEQHQ